MAAETDALQGRLRGFAEAAAKYEPRADLAPGEYRARYVSWTDTTNANGTPFLLLTLELLDAPHTGRRLTWRLPATAEAALATADDLYRAGLTVAELSDHKAREIELIALVDLGSRGGAYIEHARATGNRLTPPPEVAPGEPAAETEADDDPMPPRRGKPAAAPPAPRDLPAHVDPLAPPKSMTTTEPETEADSDSDDDDEPPPPPLAARLQAAKEALRRGKVRPPTHMRSLAPAQEANWPPPKSTRRPPCD